MTDADKILLGIIDGPIWKDDCGHGQESYIASYEALIGMSVKKGTTEKIDLYVFHNKMENRQTLCLRYGDESGDYYSPGNMLSLAQSKQWEPYTTAFNILSALGQVIWVPKKGEEHDS